MSANRGKRVSEAEFRRMWEDHSLPAQVIADRLGITVAAVGCRARIRKLPKREGGKGSGRKLEPVLFREMWEANVKPAHIAAYFGVHVENISKRARLWGFPDRDCNRWNSITMAAFILRRAARLEQAALWNADMVDGDPRRRRAAA
jgi:hypothetical protein